MLGIYYYVENEEDDEDSFCFSIDEPPTKNEVPSASNTSEPTSKFNDILRIPQTLTKKRKVSICYRCGIFETTYEDHQ